MKSSGSSMERRLPRAFKYFNRFMLLLWHLGLGNWLNAWPGVFGWMMVITHTGRKSGLPRRTPVNFALIDGDIYCTAGFGPSTDWYRNIRVQPRVEVWLPEGWWTGMAEDISHSPERLYYLRQVLVASGLAARAAGIDPNTTPDEALERATQDYRLVRIRLLTACTGPGGPGELAWVWPLATFALLALAYFRRQQDDE